MPTDCHGLRMGSLVALLATLCLILTPAVGAAQGTPPAQATPPPAPQPVSVSVGIEPSGESATVMFSNRPIVVLRARVMGRMPPSAQRGPSVPSTIW